MAAKILQLKFWLFIDKLCLKGSNFCGLFCHSMVKALSEKVIVSITITKDQSKFSSDYFNTEVKITYL